MCSQSGTTTFFPSERASASSLTPASDSAQPVAVPARTLADLLACFDISAVDLLKVDIEGAEWELLQGFPHDILVRAIVMEWHEDLHGHSVREVDGLLPQHDIS